MEAAEINFRVSRGCEPNPDFVLDSCLEHMRKLETLSQSAQDHSSFVFFGEGGH